MLSTIRICEVFLRQRQLASNTSPFCTVSARWGRAPVMEIIILQSFSPPKWMWDSSVWLSWELLERVSYLNFSNYWNSRIVIPMREPYSSVLRELLSKPARKCRIDNSCLKIPWRGRIASVSTVRWERRWPNCKYYLFIKWSFHP